MTAHDIDPNYSAKIWPEFWEKLKQSGSLTFESCHRTKDGKVFPVEVAVTFFEYKGKEYHCGFARDITERKKAEEKIRLFSDAIDSAFDCFMLTDIKGNITYANESATRAFGYNPEEFLKLNITKLDADPKVAKKITQETMAKGKWSGEVINIRKNGEKFPSLLSAFVIKDDEGNQKGTMGILRDITEQKKAQDELRSSEEKFSKAFNLSPSAVFITTLKEGRFIEINKTGLDMFGYKPDEIVGRTVKELGLWAHLNDRATVLDRLQKEGIVRNMEASFRRKSGEVFAAIISVDTVDIAGQQFLLSTCADISERKKAEETLKAERQRLHDVLEVMPIMVCLLTPDYHVAFANRAFREKFGESRGRRCYEYCFGKKEPCDFCEAYRVLKTGKPHHWQVTTPDGASVIDAYDFPFTDADGSPMILEMDIDITERKRAELQILDYRDKLRGLTAKLTLAEEQERRHIAMEVHDQIGQRMALAKLALQSLNASISDPSTHRSLEDVCKELNQVIEDTHSLTFALSNPVLYEAGFVNAVESWLVQQIHGRGGLQYTFKADPRVAPTDKNMSIVLFRVMRELLTNVVKHAKAKRVDVRIRSAGDKMRITVQDDGVGFEPSKVGLPNSKSGGYGLFSVRERLEHLGGDLKIESAPGKGTRIAVAVPAQSRQET